MKFKLKHAGIVSKVISNRRDMRHFNGKKMEPIELVSIIHAGHLAPSVGFMQPWRFIRITDQNLRTAINKQVREEQELTADALPTRGDELRKVKIDGIMECSELVIVCLADGRDKHIVGKRTMPHMDVASVGCCIQNMWLMARSMNIGMGWVSFFDPEKLGELLGLPDGAEPIAILCIGLVDEFYPEPMFQTAGWGKRMKPEDVVFENVWPADAKQTPAVY